MATGSVQKAKAGGKYGCVQRYRFGGMGSSNPLVLPPTLTLPADALPPTSPPPTSPPATSPPAPVATPVCMAMKRSHAAWESNSQESLSSQDSAEEEEFESNPSVHQLEMYEELQRTTLQMLEKARRNRSSKLERRAVRLKNLVDELHAELPLHRPTKK